MSKGARLLSANEAIKYITNAMMRCGARNMFQDSIPPVADTSHIPKNFDCSCDRMPCCAEMVCRLSDWAIMTTDMMAKPAGISYEMICAAERIAPKIEYLLFEPQPAIRMPKVSIEMIAKM